MSGPRRAAVAAAFLVFGCFPTLDRGEYVSGTIYMAPASEVPGDSDRVEFQYLGVGGWRIETPHTVLLTGPLLSRPAILEVGLGEVLKPDTVGILNALRAWDVGPLEETAAILVGHGHYDHLLDTPWMAARLAPRARILGNETTALQTLALADELGLDPGRVEDVSGSAAAPGNPGAWIPVSRDVRVLPVQSDHAPHFAGHTLYGGVREVPLPHPPGPATDWLDGNTLAFLVDVLRDDGSVALRFYYQDAIPREPAGIVPAEVLDDGVPVEAALLVPASFAEVQWHPEALVENLEPRTVLVQHWEDFFAPALEPAEPVMFTILPHFMERLERVLTCRPDALDACIQVPLPGARFRYPLR